MTLVPTTPDGTPLTEVKDRGDLPAYELGPNCMVHGCDQLREDGGGHHVWRRSNQTRSWWVELPDGTLVPNRVGLCREHHREVTGGVGGHKAAIVVRGDRLLWNGTVEIVDLVFAHDPFAVLCADGNEHDTVAGRPKPGEKCPTCQRRVNHPKKKTSPQSKVSAYRIPIDDAETHEELREAAALALDPKFTERPHWQWALNTYAYALILQGARLEERGE